MCHDLTVSFIWAGKVIREEVATRHTYIPRKGDSIKVPLSLLPELFGVGTSYKCIVLSVVYDMENHSVEVNLI